jgi:O-antigen/teichoic acid export membrane protein
MKKMMTGGEKHLKGMTQLSLKAQLLQGGLGGLLVRAGAILSGLIASVTLSRLLGPETFGVYTFVFSLITLIGLPVHMGLPTLILRETARADKADDASSMHVIWRWSDRAIALMAVLVLSGTGLYLWGVSGTASPHMSALLWALPLVPLIGWAEARSAAIRGLRRVVLGNAPDKIIRPLLLAAFTGLAFWIHKTPLAATQVYAIHGMVAVVALLVASIIRKQIAPLPDTKINVGKDSRAWITAILPLSLIAGLQAISHNTDILMLGILGMDADVGVYRVALTLSSITIFGLTTVNLVFSPYFARAWSDRDHHGLQRLATIGARLSVISTIPVVILFWSIGSWLLTQVYGEQYTGAYSALTILCVGQCVNAFFGSVGNLLTMSGREWVALSGLGISTLVNIILNWLLIPKYGAEGAAMATTASVITWNAILWVSALILLKVDSSAIGLHRHP